MKKFVLFLACSSLMASGAMAQQRLVNEVSNDINGSSADYAAAVKKLAPAFSDPETKDKAQTYYVAGKACFGLYDNLLGKKQINPTGVKGEDMGKALLEGYDYYKKALELDPVPETEKDGTPKVDKKTGQPKFKTKYTKDIISQIAGHHNDFSQAGSDLYEAKNYKGAYKAWDIFASLPTAEFLGKNKPVVADTLIGQVRFFQGIAAWQDNENEKALDAFTQARKLGYVQKEAFDYAMQCAANAKNEAAIVEIAKEALPIYGDKDGQYIRILINSYVNEKNYKEANEMLDKAMQANPNNAEFCNLKGILVENETSIDDALPYFKKAVDLDPNYAKGQFDLGRYYFNQAVKTMDANPTLSGAALAKLVNPLYEQALPYMEKAYNLDKTNTDAKNALRAIYYKLGNEAKLNAIENE